MRFQRYSLDENSTQKKVGLRMFQEDLPNKKGVTKFGLWKTYCTVYSNSTRFVWPYDGWITCCKEVLLAFGFWFCQMEMGEMGINPATLWTRPGLIPFWPSLRKSGTKKRTKRYESRTSETALKQDKRNCSSWRFWAPHLLKAQRAVVFRVVVLSSDCLVALLCCPSLFVFGFHEN